MDDPCVSFTFSSSVLSENKVGEVVLEKYSNFGLFNLGKRNKNTEIYVNLDQLHEH